MLLCSDAPVCEEEHVVVYGVSENESVAVSCQVRSFPPADTFTWSFNNRSPHISPHQSGLARPWDIFTVFDFA